MPYGIAKANHRIRPSGLLLHPDTKTGFARHENACYAGFTKICLTISARLPLLAKAISNNESISPYV